MAINLIIYFFFFLFIFFRLVKLRWKINFFLIYLVGAFLSFQLIFNENWMDLPNYIDVYNSINPSLSVFFNYFPSYKLMEFGTIYSMFFAKKLAFSFQNFMLVFFLISISIKIFVFQKISPLPFVAVLFYIAFFLLEQEYSGIRFSMAMSIVLLAFYYLSVKNSTSTFFLFILLASCFHHTALFSISFYFLRNFSLPKEFLVLLLLLCPVVNFFQFSLQHVIHIIELIPIDLIQKKLSSYTSANNMYGGKYNLNVNSATYILFGFLLVFLDKKKSSKKTKNLITIYVIGTFLFFLFSQIEVFTRLSYYYLIYGGIALSHVLFNLNKSFFLKHSILIFLFLFTFVRVILLFYIKT